MMSQALSTGAYIVSSVSVSAYATACSQLITRPLSQAVEKISFPNTERPRSLRCSHSSRSLGSIKAPIFSRNEAAAPQRQAAHRGAVTEIIEMPNRGHALTIDSGWREVADTALAFLKRFV